MTPTNQDLGTRHYSLVYVEQLESQGMSSWPNVADIVTFGIIYL